MFLMVDDLELVRIMFDADPLPADRSYRDVIRDRLSAEIAVAEPSEPFQAARSTTRSGRRSTKARVAVLAGASAALVVGAGVISAAAGVLPNPWSGPAMDKIPFVSTPDPASVAGSRVVLSVPGPESTTLEIVTDTISVAGTPATCTDVAIKEPQGQTANLLSGCGGPSAASPIAVAVNWQAPSGASYAIVNSKAPPGAATVSLSGSPTLPTVTEPVGGGYYVLYVPASELSEYTDLTFYNPAGQVVSVNSISLSLD
jgi:hypothetical protein